MEEVSLQEATAEISLQSIEAIKKEREKSIAKAPFPNPVERMAKPSFPARKDMITYNCKLLSVPCSSCLSTHNAEAKISSSD